MEQLFDEKAVQGLDYLLHHFWVLREDQPVMYRTIRERQKVLQRYVNDKLGLRLHIHQQFIKLEKIPVTPESWMGIQDFQDPIDYVIFCYALSFIESKGVDEQFLLSELCEEITVFSQEQLTLDWTLFQHRKALIRVIKFLVELHLIQTIDGNLHRFDHHEDEEVLYEVMIYSRYFMRTFPEEFTKYENVKQLIEDDRKFISEDERRKRVYRKLYTAPALYRQDVQDQDFLYIRNFRNRLSEDIEKHSDYKLHVFKSVAFLSVTEVKQYYKPFPNTRAVTDIMLQLSDYLHTQQETYQARENGDIVLTAGQFNHIIETLRELYGGGWSKYFREKSTNSIRQELISELTHWMMAAEEDGFIYIHSLLGVLIGKYPYDYKGGQADE